MIIKDKKGNELELTPTTLTEVTGEAFYGDKWSLDLKSLKNAREGVELHVLYRVANANDIKHGFSKEGEVETGWITEYNTEDRRIGCRTFDAETFAIIQKAIEVSE